MAAPNIPPPSDEEGRRLHGLLLAQDATATWDFAQAFLPYLATWLQSKNRVGADLCEAAAEEAVYGVLSKPSRYDPAKGASVAAYLRLAATRDLRNLLRREGRHKHEPLDENSVELHAASGNAQGEGNPLRVLCGLEDEAEDQAFLLQLRSSLKERDREALDLMTAGERDYEKFAKVLGVGHLSREERDAEVKRAKDRIMARARRMKEEP